MYLLRQKSLSPRVQKSLARVCEVALVSLLALQAARLVWIVLTPPPSIGAGYNEASSVRADLSLLQSFNAFALRGGNPEAGTDSDFTLHGVRVAAHNSGTAIIGIQGASQSAYVEGQEVTPGTVLKTVAPDHVILERDGRPIRLSLRSASALGGAANVIPDYIATQAVGSAASSTPVASLAAAEFLDQAALTPRVSGGAVTGYTLFTRNGGEALARAGLANGDVLVAVNGNRMTPEMFSQLEQELSSGGEIQLTIERGSASRTISLQSGGQH